MRLWLNLQKGRNLFLKGPGRTRQNKTSQKGMEEALGHFREGTGGTFSLRNDAVLSIMGIILNEQAAFG